MDNEEKMEVVFEDVEQEENMDDGGCFGEYSVEDKSCEICHLKDLCKKDTLIRKELRKKVKKK